MFILTKFADLVQIEPKDFAKHSIDAIEHNINAKYANRVVQKIGLCVCLYDILWTSEGLIGHGTGLVNVNVEFRMIVFRPFKGEVIEAKVTTQTPEGIHLCLNHFFRDIFVSLDELPWNAEFSHGQQQWVWPQPDGDPSLVFDKNEIVRVQVIDEEWHDQTPKGPNQSEDTIKTPYTIKGSMAREGLGMCFWWDWDVEGYEGEEGEEAG